jgi:hypothetical protein
MFMVGGGGGAGLFLAARDPNRYMSEWARRGADFVVLGQGTEAFVLHYIPIISIDFAPISLLRLQSASEIAYGPKVVAVSGGRDDSRLFEFVRFSEILIANFELPINDNQSTHIFLGGGAGIHHLDFEEHSATLVGYRAQLGVGLLQQKLRVDGLVAVDIVRGESERQQTWASGETGAFLLDYTSIHADAVLHFNLVP